MDNLYVQPLESAFKRLKWTISKKGFSEDEEAYNSIVRHYNQMLKEIPNKFSIIESFFAHEFLRQAKGIDEVEGISPVKRNPLDIISNIGKIAMMTEEDWVEIYMREMPLIRFELLYKDYDEELKKAKRIANKNSIPPEESENLCREYQVKDIEEVVKACQRKLEAFQKDCENALTKPYTAEEARYFLRSQTKNLLSKILIK